MMQWISGAGLTTPACTGLVRLLGGGCFYVPIVRTHTKYSRTIRNVHCRQRAVDATLEDDAKKTYKF